MGSKWSVPSSGASVCPSLWLRHRTPADRGPAATGPSLGTLSTLTTRASTARPRPSTGSDPGHRVHLPRLARPSLHRQPGATTMIARRSRLISYHFTFTTSAPSRHHIVNSKRDYLRIEPLQPLAHFLPDWLRLVTCHC